VGGTTSESFTSLRLGNTADADVEVAQAPWASVFSVLTSVVAGGERTVVAPLRRRIAHGLSKSSVAAVRPIVRPGQSVAPDCVAPLDSVTGGDFADGLDYLRTMPGDELLADLAQKFGETEPPAHWQPVFRRPRAWLRAFADAMDETWTQFEPCWRATHPLAERETGRIEVAATSGALGVVLTSMHPGAQLHGDALRLPDPEPEDYELGNRKLVLTPMITGRSAAFVGNFDLPDKIWIGYSLPGNQRVIAGLGAKLDSPADPLAILLGTVRGALLRNLDTPATMGGLARAVSCTPSQLTYHCDRLVAAGLIERQRQGRAIVVTRTARANDLLDLFV